MSYDAFISYASEDKEQFVKPLFKFLKNLGINSWFDEVSLEVGKSIRQSIDKGLKETKYGIIIFSKNFFNKNWTNYELNGFITRYNNGENLIIPIWYEISKEEVSKFSPSLADLYALSFPDKSLIEISYEILKKIKPSVYNNIIKYLSFYSEINNSNTFNVRMNKIKKGPIINDTLREEYVIRLKLLYFNYKRFLKTSFEELIDNFKRELNPHQELLIWERIFCKYEEFKANKELTKIEENEIFRILLFISMNLNDLKSDILSEQIIEDIRILFNNKEQII
jgi:hypothetical protein